MKEIVLPTLIDEPQTLEDVVYTWKVDSWRALPKKEHGPIIQAGGFPWYAFHPPQLRSLISLLTR
jgi:ubiquitin carboxyl-terminal hydrolase 7